MSQSLSGTPLPSDTLFRYSASVPGPNSNPIFPALPRPIFRYSLPPFPVCLLRLFLPFLLAPAHFTFSRHFAYSRLFCLFPPQCASGSQSGFSNSLGRLAAFSNSAIGTKITRFSATPSQRVFVPNNSCTLPRSPPRYSTTQSLRVGLSTDCWTVGAKH